MDLAKSAEHIECAFNSWGACRGVVLLPQLARPMPYGRDRAAPPRPVGRRRSTLDWRKRSSVVSQQTGGGRRSVDHLPVSGITGDGWMEPGAGGVDGDGSQGC